MKSGGWRLQYNVCICGHLSVGSAVIIFLHQSGAICAFSYCLFFIYFIILEIERWEREKERKKVYMQCIQTQTMLSSKCNVPIFAVPKIKKRNIYISFGPSFQSSVLSAFEQMTQTQMGDHISLTIYEMEYKYLTFS